MNKTNGIIINKNNNNNDLDIIKSNNNKNNRENIIYKDNNKVKMINIENFGNKKNEGQKYIKKSLNNEIKKINLNKKKKKTKHII